MKRTRIVQSPVGAEIVVDGRRYVNFGGSSYLGLSANAEVIEAGVDCLRSTGYGYQFPREFELTTAAHREAEAEAAMFFGTQAAQYLASGYLFGLVAIAALRHGCTEIFFDEWAHYSLRDAIASSGLPAYAYRHLDAADLGVQLQRHARTRTRPLVVTDGLYATFGEIAPLDQLSSVVSAYGGRLLVDESHSFGVLGNTGRGACEHHGIAASAALFGGSTCKALGVVGGIIPSSEGEVASLRVTPAGRGASVGLPAGAAMCARNLRYVREHPELLRRLRDNTEYLKNALRSLGLPIQENIAPIAAFSSDRSESLQTLQQRLMSEGIHVFHTTYIGAGPAGVIRCGIFADHKREHMDCLLDALRRLL